MPTQSVFEYRSAHSLAWNSDGSRIAVATVDKVDNEDEYQNDQIRIMNVVSGQAEPSIPIDNLGVRYLSWQNNDNELVTININADIKRFSSLNGSLIGQWTANGVLSSASIHPDGQIVALALRLPVNGSNTIMSTDKTIQIRNLTTGSLLQSWVLPIQASDRVDWVGWSPDSTRLAIVNHDHNILVYGWDGTQLSLQRQFTFVSMGTLSIYAAWGPDNHQIAVTSRQSRTGPNITIFNSEDGSVIRQLEQSTGLNAIVWNQQTNLIASREGWMARIWDASTGQVVEDFDYVGKDFSALAWSPNGTLAVGQQLTYDELVQNPNLTGVVTQRPSSLPPLTP